MAQVDTELSTLSVKRDSESLLRLLTHYKMVSTFFTVISEDLYVPCKDPRLQLPRMPLHLVSMLIYAPEKVCAPMHIHHDPLAGIADLLSLCVVVPHLDPLSLQDRSIHPPLPPLFTSNAVDPMRPELSLDGLGGLSDLPLRDHRVFRPDPPRRWDPLRRESLQVFDCVM